MPVASLVPPAFDICRKWYASAKSPSPMALQPAQWTPGSVLIGRSWVWRPGTAAQRVWILEADTARLPTNPAPVVTSTPNGAAIDAAMTPQQAEAQARLLAEQTMRANWVNAQTGRPPQGLAEWIRAGGSFRVEPHPSGP